MTLDQIKEAQAEADNHADIPVGEYLDLALKEIARLKDLVEEWRAYADNEARRPKE